MPLNPEAFTPDVADEAIADLRRRLAATRFPDQAEGPPWAYGADLAYMRDLVDYWRDEFDWLAAEARLGAFPNYRVDLVGISLHFLHVPGVGPNPRPLLLSHRPLAAGLRPVLRPGPVAVWSRGDRRLLRGADERLLGYARFGAQGGVWGAFVSARLGYAYPERLSGVHLNFLPLRRDAGLVEDPTIEERRYLNELALFLHEEAGYQAIQGTRPQTLAYGLTDSPAGLATWITEKFRA